MSRLLDNSKEIRDKNISRSIFKEGKEYNVSHSRAKSDGDDNGKGENDGNVGSKTDILQREKLIAKNLYNSSKEYDASKA